MLQLFRNVGKFDSVTTAANIPLAPLTLIYAENGRGKTTVAAILRSLATGNPLPIAERQRLTAARPPHVVLDCRGVPSQVVFQNNAWNRSLPEIVVFDDVFIDENVYSGLAVEPEQRQNLHDLILGAEGINLNRRLQQIVTQIEEHNRSLRARASTIPEAERGGLSVDEFCALPAQPNIDAAIQTAERALAAAQDQDAIRTAASFEAVNLPTFDLVAIARLLETDLPALEVAAADRVRAHLEGIGENGENWIAEGMQRIEARPEENPGPCPFCAQDLRGSPVINHYRAYFSEEYSALKQSVTDTIANINREHAGDAPIAFERSIRLLVEGRQFWSRFCDVPEITLDTADIARSWLAAKDGVDAALRAKEAAPLERKVLSGTTDAAFIEYNNHRQLIATLNERLQQANNTIAAVKERAASENIVALRAALAKLRATRARHTANIAPLCTAYLDEKAAKTQAEEQRGLAREALDQHRQTVFPAFQTAINFYLDRFNAGFNLGQVTSTNTRSGSSCTYNVVINNQAIAVSSSVPGSQSFRTTLSSGDRNTLALAFFFASLDQDQHLTNKIVVIDDPITSLDEHRSLITVQELRRLTERVAQVIVLSHNKPFLCRIWAGADTNSRAAVELFRDGDGSLIRIWDVNQDLITEHDHCHALLREYAIGAGPNNREVAKALRLVMEAFLRVAYPGNFIPGMLLGPFRNQCEQRVGTAHEILDQGDIDELRELTEYANLFHHDTNPMWQNVAINDGQLVAFVRRTIAFAKR